MRNKVSLDTEQSQKNENLATETDLKKGIR